MKLLAELVDGLIAALADGFIHLHLQDQMAAALEVQSQWMRSESSALPAPTTWETSGRPNKPKHANQNDNQ